MVQVPLTNIIELLKIADTDMKKAENLHNIIKTKLEEVQNSNKKVPFVQVFWKWLNTFKFETAVNAEVAQIY